MCVYSHVHQSNISVHQPVFLMYEGEPIHQQLDLLLPYSTHTQTHPHTQTHTELRISNKDILNIFKSVHNNISCNSVFKMNRVGSESVCGNTRLIRTVHNGCEWNQTPASKSSSHKVTPSEGYDCVTPDT